VSEPVLAPVGASEWVSCVAMKLLRFLFLCRSARHLLDP
jgi:hypothetical protein